MCTICSHFGSVGVSVVFKQMGSSFFLFQFEPDNEDRKSKTILKKKKLHAPTIVLPTALPK